MRYHDAWKLARAIVYAGPYLALARRPDGELSGNGAEDYHVVVQTGAATGFSITELDLQMFTRLIELGFRVVEGVLLWPGEETPRGYSNTYAHEVLPTAIPGCSCEFCTARRAEGPEPATARDGNPL